MKVKQDNLTPSVREQVAQMLRGASLPSALRPSRDVHIRNLSTSDPMSEGGYEVSVGSSGTSTFNGNGFNGFGEIAVIWNIEVDPARGTVYAVPAPQWKKLRGPEIRPESLGFAPCEIGNVGPLQDLLRLTLAMRSMCDLPVRYGTSEEAAELRAELGR